MKHRSLPKMFLLTIFTLGIYRLYWFAKTRKEMMDLKPVKIPSVFYLVLPLIVVFISSFIYFFAFAIATSQTNCEYTTSSVVSYRQDSWSSDDAEKTCTSEANNSTIAATILFVGSIVFVLPMTAWWLWHYSKAVEQITDGKTSFPLAMLVLYVVPDGIDILIVQDAFNKLKPVASGK